MLPFQDHLVWEILQARSATMYQLAMATGVALSDIRKVLGRWYAEGVIQPAGGVPNWSPNESWHMC